MHKQCDTIWFGEASKGGIFKYSLIKWYIQRGLNETKHEYIHRRFWKRCICFKQTQTSSNTSQGHLVSRQLSSVDHDSVAESLWFLTATCWWSIHTNVSWTSMLGVWRHYLKPDRSVYFHNTVLSPRVSEWPVDNHHSLLWLISPTPVVCSLLSAPPAKRTTQGGSCSAGPWSSLRG